MNTLKHDWQEFILLIENFAHDQKVETLLDIFLTHAEQEDLTKRYQIIRSFLIGGKPQREIAKELGISIAKVTRGANALKSTPTRAVSFLTNKLRKKT